MALSFARDEIIWLLRHADNMPKKSADDFIDKHIAELIFYMEELRAHVRKYGPVMQRYYVQYLSGFDAVVLNELVQVKTVSCYSPYCSFFPSFLATDLFAQYNLVPSGGDISVSQSLSYLVKEIVI